MQRCVVKYFGQLSCRKKMLPSDGLDLYSALITGQRHASMLSFATVDPVEVSGSHPGQMYNLVQGKWQGTSKWAELLDPLNVICEEFTIMHKVRSAQPTPKF
jgi:hypothetical protein